MHDWGLEGLAAQANSLTYDAPAGRCSAATNDTISIRAELNRRTVVVKSLYPNLVLA